jgi:hypothetical protein
MRPRTLPIPRGERWSPNFQLPLPEDFRLAVVAQRFPSCRRRIQSGPLLPGRPSAARSGKTLPAMTTARVSDKSPGERGAWFRDSEGNLLGIGQPVRSSRFGSATRGETLCRITELIDQPPWRRRLGGSSTAAHGPGRKHRRRSFSGDWSAAASLCYGNAIVPMFFHRPRGARLWTQEQPMAMHRWRSANNVRNWPCARRREPSVEGRRAGGAPSFL